MTRSLSVRWLCLIFIAVLLLAGCDDDDGNNVPVDTSSSTDTSQDTALPLADTTTDTHTADTAEDSADAPDVESDADMTPAFDPIHPGPQPPHQGEAFSIPTGAVSAGVSIGYVTGPVGVSMGGYGARSGSYKSTWAGVFKGSQGFYGYQTVKAMVVEVEGERVVLLKIPTMSSDNSLTDGTAQKLLDLYGLDLRGRILTGATHSHHTNARYWRIPSVFALLGSDTMDEEVIDRLTTEFAHTVKRAIDDLGPAQIGSVHLDEWDPEGLVYRDRRSENDPDYPKDPRLTLLAVQRLDGTPMASIINFGMHGTMLGADNDLLTEDAPGALEMKFEEHFYQQTGQPIIGMFIQSGGGDASPAGGRLGHSSEARLELLGLDAAPKIFDLYQQIDWTAETDVVVRSRRIDMRYSWVYGDDYTNFSNENGVPYYSGGMQCDDPPEGESLDGLPKNCLNLGNMMRNIRVDLPHADLHQAYMTTARIGDLFLVTLPGEPAYSVIKYLREAVEERSTTERPLNVLAFGYSQDHMLYLTHPDDWFKGGYEMGMSIWGPRAGVYFVDRQMELVDDLLNGLNRPVFYEESPGIGGAVPFEPRAAEKSLTANTLIADVEAAYERTQTVRFQWGGGDPTVSSPLVRVEREGADGVFAPIPSASGFEGRFYDNSRYNMITSFHPDPPSTGSVLDERAHDWEVQWQVPAGWSAGNHRLVAQGEYWDGAETQSYEVTSGVFAVTQSNAATLTASLDASDVLSISLSLPAVSRVGHDAAENKSWPLSGWRLLDPAVGPNAAVTVREPLSITFDVNGAPQGSSHTVAFEDASGQYLFDFTQASITLGGGDVLTVHAHLSSDITPSITDAVVSAP